MREIAADADFLRMRFARGARRARVLVTEDDVLVREIADRLHARPAGRRLPEELPRRVQHEVRLAIAAREQEQQHLRRQLFDRVLDRVRHDRVGLAGVPDEAVGRKRDPAGGRDQAAAQVAERVPVLRNRHLRRRVQRVGLDDVGVTRIVDVQHDDHRRRLRTVVGELVTHAYVHRSHCRTCGKPPNNLRSRFPTPRP